MRDLGHPYCSELRPGPPALKIQTCGTQLIHFFLADLGHLPLLLHGCPFIARCRVPHPLQSHRKGWDGVDGLSVEVRDESHPSPKNAKDGAPNVQTMLCNAGFALGEW